MDCVRLHNRTVEQLAVPEQEDSPVSHEITPEQLAASCALPVFEIVRALPALEVAGLIEPTRDGYRRSVRP